ncbi:hypothetical protein [Xanthovirga aplysinae]|uniref:hypothetical protein n=1 Tax=Xanthovirga aplysinae TaxID=2529853 RepID=UPI0012BBA5D0|nr:hypothetical protein [Xanthovirga aplysinae]MTI30250.1 hypothetical protein [Xanthovirga aplysinae]
MKKRIFLVIALLGMFVLGANAQVAGRDEDSGGTGGSFPPPTQTAKMSSVEAVQKTNEVDTSEDKSWLEIAADWINDLFTEEGNE